MLRRPAVIFSNPSEYAIRALSELVLMSQEAPPNPSRRAGFVMLDKLTEQANLPREFLAKIFRQLVEGGILTSAKGPGGGFALARPAHEITLLNVIEVVDGGHQIDGCVVGMARCNDHMPCPQHDLFKPIRQRLRAYLSTTTLADTGASLKEKKVLAIQDTLLAETPAVIQDTAQPQA
jgi:Rrf2 family transcriptional regulator, iron-sulfur cluster assembly transcription factor